MITNTKLIVLTTILLTAGLMRNNTSVMAYSGQEQTPGRFRPQTIADLCDSVLRELNQGIGRGEKIAIDTRKPIALYSIYDEDIDPPVIPRIARKPPKHKSPSLLPELRVAAVLLRDHRGAILVSVPTNRGQLTPPPKVYRNITITAVLPSNVQVLQVRSGEAKVLEKVKRVPGGTMITVPEFDARTTIVCTTDRDLFERIRSSIEEKRSSQREPR